MSSGRWKKNKLRPLKHSSDSPSSLVKNLLASHGHLGELMINLDVIYEAVFVEGAKMSYSYLYNLFSNICESTSAYI